MAQRNLDFAQQNEARQIAPAQPTTRASLWGCPCCFMQKNSITGSNLEGKYSKIACKKKNFRVYYIMYN
jgi:hypothetical protein